MSEPSPILGHERQRKSLRLAVDSDRLPHALLFSGPEGVGKRTVALRLARELITAGDPEEARRFDIGVNERLLVYSDLNKPLPVRRGDLLGADLDEDALLAAYELLEKEDWIRGVSPARGEDVIDLLERNPTRFTGRKGIPFADVLERELASLERSKKSAARTITVARRLFALGTSRALYRRSLGIELINGKGDGQYFRTVSSLLALGAGDTWRIAILDDAHRMTDAAENALLKTLEEPPPRTLLILVTSEPLSLLSTTLSRCARVPFDSVPAEVLSPFLAHTQGVPEEEAPLIAALADGSLGKALELRGLHFTERRRFVEDLLAAIAGGAFGRALALFGRRLSGAAAAKEKARDAERREAVLVLELLAVCLRDVVVSFHSPGARLLSGMPPARAAELGAQRPGEDWERIFRRTELAISDVHASVEPRLAVEALLAETVAPAVEA